ncbi:mCG21769, isoform CRA_a [Mus musculus]|nr:mCG21769, isoform CRA_a [Mus musculus]EDL27116.1 mCG21769, isoform CRA_a [Mus musculus]
MDVHEEARRLSDEVSAIRGKCVLFEEERDIRQLQIV